MAKSLRNALKTSTVLEREGVFLERGNTRVRLRRAGGSNTAFNFAMAKIMKDHGRALQNGLISDEAAMKLLHRVFAEHVVLTWETDTSDDDKVQNWESGIETADGSLAPVTVDNIVAYWIDVPDWFNEVKSFSEDLQYYREALLSQIAGE